VIENPFPYYVTDVHASEYTMHVRTLMHEHELDSEPN
jgi:hypothetical protein